jgi:undecaprenyl-diphosphatase
VTPVNYQLFHLINSHAGRLDALDDVMEFAATWLIYGIFAAYGLALLGRPWGQILRAGATLVVAFAAALALSRLSGQLRPFQTHAVQQLIPHDPGVSLPSDHATAAFAMAFSAYAFLRRSWGLALAVAACAVGFARVWAGVHYPGDILAGALIAALAAAAVHLISRLVDRHGSLREPLTSPTGCRRLASVR